MDNVLESVYNFIDVLDESTLINNLKLSKKKVEENTKLMELINESKNISDNNTLLWYRQEIYKYDEYKEYMKLYNELSLIILDINNRLKKIVH